MARVVFLRHGESRWNKRNLFTGWTDVALTDKGRRQAREAGKILKKRGFRFDVAFTSLLERAQETLNIVFAEMGITPSVHKSWRLNERHYGALQGLNKKETAKKYGEDTVFRWRRGFDVRPPELAKSDKRHPTHNLLYRDVPEEFLPSSESLKDMLQRTIPYWEEEVVPYIKRGKNVLIVGHGTNIRGMRKYLEGISDKEIENVDIPYAVPLVYEFDEHGNMLRHYYLGDEAKIAKVVGEIRSQIKTNEGIT